MLNWRRDPDYEMRMSALRSEIEQIKSETEQLRRENKRLHQIESRLDALLLSADSCSSTPPRNRLQLSEAVALLMEQQRPG